MPQKIADKLKDRKGFTLIELIVVIAILGILAAILIPQFTGFRAKAKSTQALVNAKQVATAGDALIAEGRTVYNEFGASESNEMDASMIMTLAGSDILGTISNPSIADDRFLFTYTDDTIDSIVYKVVRDPTGAFKVTW